MKKLIVNSLIGFLSVLSYNALAVQGVVGASISALYIDGTAKNNLTAPFYSGGYLFESVLNGHSVSSPATVTVPANYDSAVVLSNAINATATNNVYFGGSTQNILSTNYGNYTVFAGDGISPNLFVKTPLTTTGTYSFSVSIYSGRTCYTNVALANCTNVGTWNSGASLAPATANVYYSIAVPTIPIKDCVVIFTVTETGGATTSFTLSGNLYSGTSLPN